MAKRFDVRDKGVLVTGASSGIGAAVARELGRKGARLVLASRRREPLERLADVIEKGGAPRPVVITADLGKRGEAQRLANEATKALGRVDVVVNNAGVGMGGGQAAVGDDEAARDLFETNYWSPLALVRALVPAMQETGSGVVVNVSSMGAILPFPLTGHYGSSKAALTIGSDALRMELRGSGVSVLVVSPGPVATPMLAEAGEIPGLEGVLGRIPKGSPDELARLVVRGIERGHREIVYPRPLWLLRWFPTFAAWTGAAAMRDVDVTDTRVVRGGSGGDAIAIAARERFEALAAARAD